MKYLKYLLIVFILLLSPNVFAASQTISNKIEALPNFGGGTYYATQPVSVPVPLYQNIGTRYNGKLSLIEFYLDNSDWNWNYNKTYTITLNMATDDWRNNFMGPHVIQCNCDGSQQSSSSSSYVNNTFRFVSYKTIKFNFKLGSTMGCKTKFRLYSGNTSSIAITGVSNYNLSSVVISDTTSPPTPTPVAPVPTSTPSPGNQDIINNQNQNTQDIINNQNQNSQDVINNNTQNTSDIIENNNQNNQIINDNLNSVCKSGPYNITDIFIDKSLIGKELKSDGSIGNWSSAGITKYLSIKPNEDYTIYFSGGSVNSVYYCLYTADKTVVSCSTYSNRSEINFNSGQYVSFLRLTVPFYRIMSIKGPICNDFTVDAQNDTTDAINKQTNYLMDNSDPNIQDNDFLSMFNSVGINDPLSYLLTLPTQLINKIVSLSDSCSPIELGSLYGTMLTLPCINIGNLLGSNLWNIVDVILSVSLLVVIFKNLYDTFSNLLTMGAEKEAKEKFSMPTPMDFLSMILGGDR